MKFLAALCTIFALNSCNTMIGMWRDTQEACSWTQQKIQGSSDGGNTSGAPVY